MIGLPTSTDVLIVGAGPTGLTLALSLLLRDRSATIVDRLDAGSNTSRAAVVYPGTLEALSMYGVSEELADRGIRASRFTIRDRDTVLTPVSFDSLDTDFPFTLLISQAVTESVLLNRLHELGGNVIRPCNVTGVHPDGVGVDVVLDGEHHVHANVVIGADGVHSTVRNEAKIALTRRGEEASYALGDVHLSGGVPDDELVVFFSPAGHLVVLPLPGGLHRLVGHVDQAPQYPDVSFFQRLIETRGPRRDKVTIHDVVWGSRFYTSHGLASQYRVGRVMLAGDAAHEHSPLGGQGMNLGIHDAVALGEALATGALDTYQAMQRPMARDVIEITSLLTRLATASKLLRPLRNLAVRAMSPMIRTRLARRLSQLEYLGRPRGSRGSRGNGSARLAHTTGASDRAW